MNLTLKHHSGRQNVNVDALSRNSVTNSNPVSNSNEILDACGESRFSVMTVCALFVFIVLCALCLLV